MYSQMKHQDAHSLACLFDIVFKRELKKLDTVQQSKASELTEAHTYNTPHLHSSFPSVFTLNEIMYRIITEPLSFIHTFFTFYLLVYAH